MSKTDDTLKHRVLQVLKAGRLASAISMLIDEATALSDADTLSRLRGIENVYGSMRHYFLEGMPDSSREQVIRSLHSDLLQIAILLDSTRQAKDSGKLYYSTSRILSLHPKTFEVLLAEYNKARRDFHLSLLGDTPSEAARNSAEQALRTIFEYVWTLGGNKSRELKQIKDAILSDDSDYALKIQLITALFFALSQVYDSEKLLTLIDIYDITTDDRIAARALTSIMLVLPANHRVVEGDARISGRLEAWKDSILTYSRMREVLMTIVRTADVAIMEQRMKDDILPELKKMKSRIDEIKNDPLHVDQNIVNAEGELNPEWEQVMRDSGLEAKMRELSEMQDEGSDVMMVTFSQLKNFPFFSTMSNWFLPFDMQNSHLAQLRELNSATLESLLVKESPFCDSDKYSFALAFNTMPKQQRDMMVGQLDGAMAQMEEMMRETRQRSSRPDFDAEVNRYVRDLHRFFKYFRNSKDFTNPFERSFPFLSLPVVREMVADTEIVKLVAEYYFKRKLMQDAIPLFEMLSKDSSDDGTVWEKLGYAYQTTGQIEKALKYYTTAEFFKPDSKWLMRRQAYCHKTLGQYAQAAEYYQRLLAQDEDNMNLLLNLAHCLLRSGKHAEALALYYKADYMEGSNASVWRSIAWTEMLSGNLEKGERYVEKALASQAEVQDVLNQGHIQFLRGKYRQALAHYNNAIRLESEKAGDVKVDKFQTRIRENLYELGVKDRSSIDLLLDEFGLNQKNH